MKTFYKLISLISLSILLFVLNSPFAFALEVSYPDIPGLTKPVENDLPSYIAYLFGFGTYIAGIIAIISFAIGAVQLVMSASNPSLSKDAKDRMLSSIFGLILTLSAFVILQTINSKFVTPTLTVLPGGEGIFYTNGSDYKPAPQSEADTENIPEGYDKLIYRCNSGPALLVWIFPNKNFDYNGATTKRLTCGDKLPIGSAKSFKWEYETAGVYYCMDGCNGDMCSGYMSEANWGDQDEIESPFKGKIKGVRIVNNTSDSFPQYFGAIFHKEIGITSAGECTEPIVFTTKGSGCKAVNIPAFSANIFQLNRTEPETSGSGATFYNKTYGWNADVKSGKFDVTKEQIQEAVTWTTDDFYKKNANEMIFDYSGVETMDAYMCKNQYPSCADENSIEGDCCPCSAFQNCPGSVRIKGDYIVGLYSYIKNDKNKLYCETFTSDIESLDAYNYVESGNKIEYVDIIPIIY